jgi:hypothetical protein
MHLTIAVKPVSQPKTLRQNLLIEENNLIPFFPFCVISALMIVVVIERIMMIRVLL